MYVKKKSMKVSKSSHFPVPSVRDSFSFKICTVPAVFSAVITSAFSSVCPCF